MVEGMTEIFHGKFNIQMLEVLGQGLKILLALQWKRGVLRNKQNDDPRTAWRIAWERATQGTRTPSRVHKL